MKAELDGVTKCVDFSFKDGTTETIKFNDPQSFYEAIKKLLTEKQKDIYYGEASSVFQISKKNYNAFKVMPLTVNRKF